jgi:hypothetical protein
MQVSPKPEVVKQLKRIAQKQGISLNALLVPFLIEIAEGRLEMKPNWRPPHQQRAA